MQKSLPLLILALTATAASARPFTARDLHNMQRISETQGSPKGDRIAFTVRTTDWKENRFDTEIWLARGGEAPFQLTRTERGSSTGPRWSPDGRWIAFTADRGDRNQVYLVRAAGGEARKLTAWKEGVGAFRWAPDGRRIAFTKHFQSGNTLWIVNADGTGLRQLSGRIEPAN